MSSNNVISRKAIKHGLPSELHYNIDPANVIKVYNKTAIISKQIYSLLLSSDCIVKRVSNQCDEPVTINHGLSSKIVDK